MRSTRTGVDGRFRQIANSGSFNNVSDQKSLNGLVLCVRVEETRPRAVSYFGNAAAAVGAADKLDVTTTVLGSSVIAALLRLKI
jgi:hypothetical protein